MMVFKYLLRVFKYLTTAYTNHLVKEHVSSLIALHICLLDFAEFIRRSKIHV